MKIPPETMKNQPGTMNNHENRPGTTKNHETQDKVIIFRYKQTNRHFIIIYISALWQTCAMCSAMTAIHWLTPVKDADPISLGINMTTQDDQGMRPTSI